MSGILSGMRIGFVGLGLMGRPMAARLAEAGASLALWNRTIETAEREAARLPNAEVVSTPKDAADGADLTIVIVTDTDAVEAVVFDPFEDRFGVIHGCPDDGLIIDMGTTDPRSTQALAARALKRGVEWVDAPVSGGTGGAEAGTLAIMAGGTDAAFARAEPVFRVLGRQVTHLGGVGSGQTVKTANQMIVGMTVGAVAEAIALVEASGVAPDRFREAVRGGYADSPILEVFGARMIDEDFRARGKATLLQKDLKSAAALAATSGLDLPGLAANLSVWNRLVETGSGDLDTAAFLLAVDPSLNPDKGEDND